ncbi:zinc finger protein-like 1, partial [Passer montanus]|uniref:zinc finger protein-like 1 n=1 Tax=Passer montanus TaxID=9160 RepID=UPI00196074E1
PDVFHWPCLARWARALSLGGFLGCFWGSLTPLSPPDVFHWPCLARWARALSLWVFLGFPDPPFPPDVFHWPCLARWARALSPRTAPAGHRCPQCGGPLFPPPNLQGPVAEALRARLRSAPWARPGLGLPLPPPSPPAPHAVGHMGGGETPTLHAGSAPRKPLGGREVWSPPARDRGDRGDTEDKYRRRPLAWLPPRLRCRVRGVPRRPLLALCLGGAAAFALLLLLLASLARGVADADPALEPLNNPHVRVGN